MADDEPDDDDFDLEAARKAAEAPKKKKNEKNPKGHGFGPGTWKSGDITMKKEDSLYIMNKHEYQLKTAPFDARFPNQNQTRNCWQNYVDFNRCIKLKGEDYDPCEYFKRIYRSLCPNAWVEKWDEQVENGTFPGKI